MYPAISVEIDSGRAARAHGLLPQASDGCVAEDDGSLDVLAGVISLVRAGADVHQAKPDAAPGARRK